MFIESGPATVFDAGTVTTFAGHPLTVVFEVPPGDRLVVQWVFLAGDVDAPTVETEHTAVGIRLDCSGFDDASGRGTAEPMLLGEVGDDLLFLHFRVFRYGNTADRTLHYSAYRVAKGSVGWQPAS